MNIENFYSALHALTVMSKRIPEDNKNAKKFAEILKNYDFVDLNEKLVQTNILRFKLKHHSQQEFIKSCATPNIISILLLEVSGGFLRCVFHNDAKGNEVDLGMKKLAKVCDNLQGPATKKAKR